MIAKLTVIPEIGLPVCAIDVTKSECRGPDFVNPFTVETILKSQVKNCPKLRNVHQLDYATSGIYVLATTKPAARNISTLFEKRLIKKTYLAIVQGHMSLDRY
jgi:tRNA pseudouridine32 synthase/23S rRNA pseudouridine746 synthase